MFAWRKKMKLMTALVSVLLFASCSGAKERMLLAEGNFHFARGEYAKAAGEYMEALADAEAAPYAAYALGAAYLSLEQDATALARFALAEQAAALPENRELIYRCRYNSGVVRFGNGDFAGAAADFKRALEADSGRTGAKRNLELSILRLSLQHDAAQESAPNESVRDANSGRKSEILFEFARRVEAGQPKTWDLSGKTDGTAPDY
jgi:tetratricopeptide (TPR) repeat protein